MTDVILFLFILLLPLLLTGILLVLLFGVGGMFYVLSHPDETRQRIEGWRHRRRRPPRPHWFDRFRHA